MEGPCESLSGGCHKILGVSGSRPKSILFLRSKLTNLLRYNMAMLGTRGATTPLSVATHPHEHSVTIFQNV